MNVLAKLFSLSLFLLLFSSPAFSADERDLQIHGDFDSKLHISAEQVSISSGTLDGGRMQRNAGTIVLQSKEGKNLGSAKTNGQGEVELQNAEGKVVYLIRPNDKGYLLLNDSKATMNRVKIKEDKFNLYDAADTRLLHGKQKEDGWGVKDEKDKQTLKVKGARNLEEVSYLALPLAVEYRLLAWGSKNF